ncbi:MAG TPA: AraC family transcriptional regulator [Thermoanaerobaculia bacterium]|nr:AraC family transcriptional regulator [Thermoanaerobaculia bacterium]
MAKARWQVPLGDPETLQAVFDQVPDIVFFVKDAAGKYRVVNRTLAERCGIPHRDSIAGRTAAELFPAPLGNSYAVQDQLVLQTGVEIRDKLELHLYPGRAAGWCLTFKTPLRDAHGAIVGLIGISRDIHDADARHPEYSRLAQAVQRLRDRHAEPLRLGDVARGVDLSLDRFERLCKKVFHLTPQQLLARARLDEATRLLRETDDDIASIAYACGYSDHSAFTRQFRATVGLTPSAYRASTVTRNR